MSSIPSRVLDNEPVTTEVTVPEPNDRTCTRRIIFGPHVHASDLFRVVNYSGESDECGAPATHAVFRTCCGAPMRYACEVHVNVFDVGNSTICRTCHHRCVKGVCCHRVVTPL